MKKSPVLSVGQKFQDFSASGSETKLYCQITKELP